MRKSGRAQARLGLVTLKFAVKLLNLGFQPGNLVVEDASAIRNRIGTFFEPCHVLNQRRKSSANKPMPTSNTAAAKGQVRANPKRNKSPRLYPVSTEFAGILGATVAPSRSSGWPANKGNLSREEFHSMRAFSSVVRARVSSESKLLVVQSS